MIITIAIGLALGLAIKYFLGRLGKAAEEMSRGGNGHQEWALHHSQSLSAIHSGDYPLALRHLQEARRIIATLTPTDYDADLTTSKTLIKIHHALADTALNSGDTVQAQHHQEMARLCRNG